MYTAGDVERAHSLRQTICYYLDLNHPTADSDEYLAYLARARNYLGDLVAEGYTFLRANGYLDEFLQWYIKEFK